MTAAMLLRALCEHLRRLVTDYAAAQGSNGAYVTPQVFDWDLPFKNSRMQEQKEKKNYFPFIVARINNGEDPAESPDALLLDKIQIDLVFGVYSEGTDDEGFVLKDGAYDLLNLMEHIRQGLFRAPLLNEKYRIERPYKWHIPDEQPYPLWIGFAESIWSVQRVIDEQNGGFLHGHKFDWE